MIIKNQVLSVVLLLKHSVFLLKKFKSELSTNKQPSLSWRVPCVIQNRNKFHHSNSVTFDTKKAKETLMARLNGITITETKTFVRLEEFTWWKTPLNILKYTGFKNLPKRRPSFHSFIHLVVCDLHRQVDFSWHFYAKESAYWGCNGCQSSWNEEGRMQGVEAYERDFELIY